MNDHQVEIKPKQWFKYFMYMCAVVGFLMAAFNLYIMWNSPTVMSGMQDGSILYIALFAASIALLLTMPLVIPHFYKLRLILNEDGIQQRTIFTKIIPYQEIETIKVMNGHIEIRGKTIRSRISFGNLYTNFDSAVAILADQIADIQTIIIKGSSKYSNIYFNR